MINIACIACKLLDTLIKAVLKKCLCEFQPEIYFTYSEGMTKL